MFKWRLLVEEGRKAGHTFSQPDLIIAATALHHGLTVVWRDVRRLSEGSGAGAQSVERGAAGRRFGVIGYCEANFEANEGINQLGL